MPKTFSKLTNLGMIMSVKNKTKVRELNGLSYEPAPKRVNCCTHAVSVGDGDLGF
ncbi:TPA: hypothetical protein ACTXW4_000009 [Legionella anisa]